MANVDKEKFSAAALAATRINAILMAKGKSNNLITNEQNFDETFINHNNDELSYHIDIEFIDPIIKKIITQNEIIFEIEKNNSVTIKLQKQNTLESEKDFSYISQIFVVSRNKDKLINAVKKLNSIITYITNQIQHGSLSQNKVRSHLPNPQVLHFQISNLGTMGKQISYQYPLGHYIQEKVFVGLDQVNDSTFPLKDNLQGPNSCYLDHIRKQTGATISIRGKGSGFLEPASGKEAWEPLHIHIMSNTKEGVEAAKKLAQNLIDTVHTKYTIHQQTPPPYAMPAQPTNFTNPYMMNMNQMPFFNFPNMLPPFPPMANMFSIPPPPPPNSVNNFTLRPEADMGRVINNSNDLPSKSKFRAVPFAYDNTSNPSSQIPIAYPLPNTSYSTMYPLPVQIKSPNTHDKYDYGTDSHVNESKKEIDTEDKFWGTSKKIEAENEEEHFALEKKSSENTTLPNSHHVSSIQSNHNRPKVGDDFNFKIPQSIPSLSKTTKRKRVNVVEKDVKASKTESVEKSQPPVQPLFPGLTDYGSESDSNGE